MAQIRKFGLSGFSRADEASFSELFKSAARRAAADVSLAPEAEAEALIIDADSIYGQMGLMQAQSSGKLLIAITAGSRVDADHRLSSPVQESDLADLLSKILGASSRSTPAPARSAPPPPAATQTARSETRPATGEAAPRAASTSAPGAAPPAQAAAAPATPAAAPPEVAKVEASRDRSLFEYLQPGMLSQPVIIERASAPLLVIDPGSRTYLGGASLKPYVAYLSPPLASHSVKPLPAARLPELEAELGGRQPIQRLLWLAALYAGEGQLIGFDAGTRFKLGKWPQIEREFPKHFRIATVMMKAAATVDEIAAASGASREEVCDLLNAYLATGFAEPEQGQASAAAETARTGLLNRLRGLRG